MTSCGQIVAVTVALVTFFVMMDQRLDRIDIRLERLEIKFDDMNGRLTKLESRLTKLENLVILDVSWRYLYQNDPARKHLRPLYHPDTNTLELVPMTSIEPTTIRKP